MIEAEYKVRTDTGVLAEAIMFAANFFGNMKDRIGKPMILHSMEVMVKASELSNGDEGTMVVAVLHDVLEDTGASFEDIRQMFGDEIANDVHSLTRVPPFDYNDYMDELLVNGSLRARLVKLADLSVNIARPGDGAENLRKRYALAIRKLTA